MYRIVYLFCSCFNLLNSPLCYANNLFQHIVGLFHYPCIICLSLSLFAYFLYHLFIFCVISLSLVLLVRLLYYLSIFCFISLPLFIFYYLHYLFISYIIWLPRALFILLSIILSLTLSFYLLFFTEVQVFRNEHHKSHREGHTKRMALLKFNGCQLYWSLLKERWNIRSLRINKHANCAITVQCVQKIDNCAVCAESKITLQCVQKYDNCTMCAESAITVQCVQKYEIF